MSERKHTENLQHQAEHTRPRRRASVMVYLVVLFAVAFLLLLLAYFQQQRQSNETTDALKQSISAVQTIEKIIEDNASLKDQVQQLEAETAQLDSARREQDKALTQMSGQLEAMQWFWQIDDYYARGSYRSARGLIEEFEALGLKDSLPTENTTGTDRFSPAERYAEIYQALY